MTHDRAWILLPSGRRLDLLAPDPDAWTDRDLAIGLSRTYRWAGYSAWNLPLSVAQHSLTVLALCEGSNGPDLTSAEQLRELLHDGIEALMGGWDPITPLKPHLGKGYTQLAERIQAAIDIRYALPPWTPEILARHKAADRLAAASEAHHVAGWSLPAMQRDLRITLAPLAVDPLPMPQGMRSWEPWPPRVAQSRFLSKLEALLTAAKAGRSSVERAGAAKAPGQAIQAGAA